MYSGLWDKLLVDVRRSVKVAGRDGKTEHYTATVCVGNFKARGRGRCRMLVALILPPWLAVSVSCNCQTVK